MLRTLDTPSGSQGGPTQLAKDVGKARNIFVSVINPTAATHAVFFGRSRRELVETPPAGIGQAGFPVIAVPNTVVNQTVNGVSYGDFILQGWAGELWACADAGGAVLVDVLDSGSIEK